jgi:arylsulfatase
MMDENRRSGGLSPRPNIILIMADDMGYSDIGCYGSEITTPNLNKLAHEGVQFTQFYNCARCCPTRASLLTGLQPHQAGIGHMTPPVGGLPAYQGYLNDRSVTIAEALRAGGYQTFMSGKWHVGGEFDLSKGENEWNIGGTGHPTPLQRGFDEFYGTLDGCSSYYNPHTLIRNDKVIHVHRDEDYYYTDAISDEATNMISRAAESDEPFFLYVAYTAPHWPLHAKPEDIAKYEGYYNKGWDRIRTDRHEKMIDAAILDEKWKISPRDEQAEAWHEYAQKHWEAMRMAVYAAQIDCMDQGIGRILDKLYEEGLTENTLIMFLSDNGGCAEFLAEDGPIKNQVWPMRDGRLPRIGNIPDLVPGPENTYMSYDLPWANSSNSPFRLFKHYIHEGGIATPFIAYWPAVIEQHRLVHANSHVMDVMATCLDIAGVDYSEEFCNREVPPLEGESFLPVLTGKEWKRSKPLAWEHEGHCAVRDDNWKLVKKFGQDWELYNMEQDRTELIDLSGKNKPKVEKLVKIHEEFTERCNVSPWEEIRHLAPYQDHM